MPDTPRQGLFPALIRNACLVASLVLHGMLVGVVMFAGADPAGSMVRRPPMRVFLEDRPGADPTAPTDIEQLPPVDELPPESVAPELESIDEIAPEEPSVELDRPKVSTLPEPEMPDFERGDEPDATPGARKPPADPILALLPGGRAEGDEGVTDPYAGRRNPQSKRALRDARGGSAQTAAAVSLGLEWLAAHQDDDGRWDPDGFARHDPADDRSPNTRFADAHGDEYEVGLTGLAALAFLGDGHTHREGDYKDNVSRAIDWIEKQQRPDGGIGQDERRRVDMYGHAIATLVLAEAAALTGDAKLAPPLRDAVAFIARAQSDSGGWNYFDSNNSIQGRDDTSVTGWQIMALVSARNAGVDPPKDIWLKALSHIESLTLADGRLRYANKGKYEYRRGSPLAAVGMTVRLLMGFDPGADIVRRASEALDEDRPGWDKLAHANIRDEPYVMHSMYGWYYGTLALSQVEGEVWRRWNRDLKSTLLENQSKQGSARGSWDPRGIWAMQQGGRIYSTALNVLNLEVYYRLLPLYRIGGSDVLIDPIAERWQDRPDVRRRLALVRLLGQLSTKRAAPLLGRIATDDRVPSVRLEALAQLASRDDDALYDTVETVWDKAGRDDRLAILTLVAGHDDVRILPLVVNAVVDRNGEVAQRAANLFADLTGRRVAGDLPVETDEEVAAMKDSLTGWIASTDRPLVSQRTMEVAGRVTAILPDQGKVMTDLGAADGIRKGMALRLLRGERVIGRCVIERVFAGGSVGRLEGPAPEAPQRGDNVVARVEGKE